MDEAEGSPASAHTAGGMETVIEKAPWMVSLGSKDGTQWGHGCGGTIIGPHALLTAAHCKSVM